MANNVDYYIRKMTQKSIGLNDREALASKSIEVKSKFKYNARSEVERIKSKYCWFRFVILILNICKLCV